MRQTTRAVLAATAVLVTSACLPARRVESSAAAAPAATQPADGVTSEEARQREIERRAALRGAPARAPVPVDRPEGASDRPPLVEDMPSAILDPMKADLAQRLGDAAKNARVVRAEQVTWPDGSIGCAQPGKLYTQALVPGYLVQFELDGKAYRYHAALNGSFVFCERPGPYLPAGGPAQ